MSRSTACFEPPSPPPPTRHRLPRRGFAVRRRVRAGYSTGRGRCDECDHDVCLVLRVRRPAGDEHGAWIRVDAVSVWCRVLRSASCLIRYDRRFRPTDRRSSNIDKIRPVFPPEIQAPRSADLARAPRETRSARARPPALSHQQPSAACRQHDDGDDERRFLQRPDGLGYDHACLDSAPAGHPDAKGGPDL